MVCPLCPTAGFFGGALGAYIGIKPPSSFKGRCLSLIGTGSLVVLTILALKKMFNISFCNGATLSLQVIAVVLAKTFILGLIYSIGVNLLISRTLERPVEPPAERRPPCCHCV